MHVVVHNVTMKTRQARAGSKRTRSNGTTMNDPLDILQNEHDNGLRLLERMESAALSIERNGFSASAFDQIKDAMKKINISFRRHMEKEEHFLFPLLARHSENPARIVRTEHWELWRAYNDLLLCVKDVEEGRIHGKSIIELLRGMKYFIEQFRVHMEKEASVIFPLVKKLLTQDEYEELRESIVPVRPAS